MPLSDLRILDLSRILAGPYCTMMLGDLGAEVIKVEAPGGGDGTRQWGPPWAGDQSAYFLTANRNKRALVLDLKQEDGRAILRQLAARADVLVENFMPGTMAGFGLSYKMLAAANPGLIYCAISGYGQDGPRRDEPGYDFAIQAEGGLMSITGPAEGEPHKTGVAIVDITAGLFAAQAILAALHERGRSGIGQFIDIALLDSQLGWLANVAQNYLVSGETPGRYGNAHPNIVPYQSFATADSPLALAVGNDAQFARLCMAVGRPAWASDSRFQTNPGRVAHRAELIPLLEALFAARPVAEWLVLLRAVEIPCAPVNDIPAALAGRQVAARDMVQEVTHPTAGPLSLIGPVPKLSRTPAAIQRPPPLLGEHTEEILSELGYDAAAVQALRSKGVLG